MSLRRGLGRRIPVPAQYAPSSYSNAKMLSMTFRALQASDPGTRPENQPSGTDVPHCARLRRSLDLHPLGDWTHDPRELVVFPQDAYPEHAGAHDYTRAAPRANPPSLERRRRARTRPRRLGRDLAGPDRRARASVRPPLRQEARLPRDGQHGMPTEGHVTFCRCSCSLTPRHT